jgi:hypothetical protein
VRFANPPSPNFTAASTISEHVYGDAQEACSFALVNSDSVINRGQLVSELRDYGLDQRSQIFGVELQFHFAGPR